MRKPLTTSVRSSLKRNGKRIIMLSKTVIFYYRKTRSSKLIQKYCSKLNIVTDITPCVFILPFHLYFLDGLIYAVTMTHLTSKVMMIKIIFICDILSKEL